MNKIMLSALGLLAARSPRLRKFAPAIPLLIAAYGMYKRHKAGQPTGQLEPARA